MLLHYVNRQNFWSLLVTVASSSSDVLLEVHRVGGLGLFLLLQARAVRLELKEGRDEITTSYIWLFDSVNGDLKYIGENIWMLIYSHSISFDKG